MGGGGMTFRPPFGGIQCTQDPNFFPRDAPLPEDQIALLKPKMAKLDHFRWAGSLKVNKFKEII